jgi:predicted porin
LKSTLILAALAGLLAVPVAHAQSSATLIGLSKAHLRYVTDPNSEHGWFSYDMPHCRRFGLGMMGDLGSRFHPHFVLDTDPMSSTDRRFGAMATMHA